VKIINLSLIDPDFNQKFKTKNVEPEKKDEKLVVDLMAKKKNDFIDAKMRECLPVILPKGRMAEKLKLAHPYNMFLTTVTDSPQTHTEMSSVTFLELFDSSLGELESTVQFNFMIDINWLIAQYTFARCQHLPLLIFHGSDDSDELENINAKMKNVMAVKVKINTPYGCHHTKMALHFYKDKSMRIFISTANLYADDWHNRVQGIWISDKLPALDDEENDGESKTYFKSDFIKFLKTYNIPKMQPVIEQVKKIDFGSVNVFFISSTPGTHINTGTGIEYGHPKIGALLSKHSAKIKDSSSINMQASSIGNLGPSPNTYLCGEIASSFGKDCDNVNLRKASNVKVIYPTLNNVLNSYDHILGGGCLPYNEETNKKQLWLKNYLYQWKSSSRNRTRSMPHIKTYCRFDSDDGLYWFILTSANLSRSAMGSLNKTGLAKSLRINSFEAGVLFFPRIIINNDTFPMNEEQKHRIQAPIFQLPYDVPINYKHDIDDVPFCSQHLAAYLA
jgi:tyrosyl-DNA phosphodiesterase-1